MAISSCTFLHKSFFIELYFIVMACYISLMDTDQKAKARGPACKPCTASRAEQLNEGKAMALRFTPRAKNLTAWGIDLGTTNSTLCCARLAAGSQTPEKPEVQGLAQPTLAGPLPAGWASWLSTTLPRAS